MPATSSAPHSAVRSAVVRIADRAGEVYVEVGGILSSSESIGLRTAWEDSQSTLFWRRFVVAISELDGYDFAGLTLLRKMYRQGVVYSAPTPRSLLFLKEIAREREPNASKDICCYWSIQGAEEGY